MNSGGEVNFVAIEGVIAAGKSTTVKLLAERLGAIPVYERFEDNPFLAAFGTDPKSCALETEMAFLLLHHFGLKRLERTPWHVSDFSIQKDLVFALVNLEGEDLELFKGLYSSLVRRTPSPRHTIFLDVPPECLFERLRKRGRVFEEMFPIDYLERLRSTYLELLEQSWPNCIRIDVAPGEPPGSVVDRVLKLLPRLASPPPAD